MSHRRIGISVLRREAALIGHERGKGAISFSLRQARPTGQSAAQCIEGLLLQLPPDWQKCDLSIALSCGDLSCADCFEVPYRSAGSVATIAGSLAESRCAGENAEDMAIDLAINATTKESSTIEIVAIAHSMLDEIRATVSRCVPKCRLQIVSSIPSLLARAIETDGIHGFCFDAAAEGVLISTTNGKATGWRGFPLDSSARNAEEVLKSAVAASFKDQAASATVLTGSSAFRVAGCDVEIALLPACAAALAQPGDCANLLHGALDAPRQLGARLRNPLLWAGAAAAILLFALGAYFEQQRNQVESDLAILKQSERKLYEKLLSGEKYTEDQLLTRMRRVLQQHTKEADANRVPSALAFWGELAGALPNPDQIGMSVESLQLSAESGRITGRVNKGPSDPLSNAALLESSVNASPALAARGEFENKEGEVVVRLNLNYRPSAQSDGGRKK